MWQPIETAPRDGTWFFGWNGIDVKPYRYPETWEVELHKYDGPCLADHTWGGTLFDGLNEPIEQPTHWCMPQPDPPTS